MQQIEKNTRAIHAATEGQGRVYLQAPTGGRTRVFRARKQGNRQQVMLQDGRGDFYWHTLGPSDILLATD